MTNYEDKNIHIPNVIQYNFHSNSRLYKFVYNVYKTIFMKGCVPVDFDVI